MNIVLWILQVLLALAFIMAGVTHGFRQEQAKVQYKWPADVSSRLLTFIGTVEILGGIGLILPAITGILTWLTPLAALGLAIIMALAIVFHFRRQEYPAIGINAILLVMAAVVAYGRGVIAPF